MLWKVIEYIPHHPNNWNPRRKIMTPNPHYINMMINIGIFGMLIYVAVQVS
jgi:hypothetical protein